MRCLVILAHPLQTSLNHHLANHARTTLEAAGHDVEFIDLYKQDFEARLSGSERSNYKSQSDRASDVAAHGRALQDAEMLVLVFPTWWFGLPAILKGWFDRVFVPGIAFDESDDLGAIKPRLKKMKRIVAITTLGSPWWVDRLVMLQPVKRILKTAIFRSCAPQSSFTYLPLYSSEIASVANIEAFNKRISKALR